MILPRGEKNFGDALKNAGVQFASQVASSIIAEQIGSYYAKKEVFVDRELHKVAHGDSAATFACAGAAVPGKESYQGGGARTGPRSGAGCLEGVSSDAEPLLS